jgi:hypothetical protein
MRATRYDLIASLFVVAAACAGAIVIVQSWASMPAARELHR